MRWLITGGLGFIGTALVDRLMQEGTHDVTVLDKRPAGHAVGRCHVVRGDVRDPETVTRCAASQDIVVHLAAEAGIAASIDDPIANATTNVLGTLNVLEAARTQGARRVVFASSGAAVGKAEPPIDEDTLCRPVSPYGAAKLAGEAYCAAYRDSFGLDAVALRFGNVYGPGSREKGSVVATWMRRILAGEPWEIHGDGSQVRDFIFIEDLVDAICKAASAPETSPVYQIASSQPVSILELSRQVVDAMGRGGIDVDPPKATAAREGDIARSWADITRATRELGWRPRHTLNSGLDATLRWFKGTLHDPAKNPHGRTA